MTSKFDLDLDFLLKVADLKRQGYNVILDVPYEVIEEETDIGNSLQNINKPS